MTDDILEKLDTNGKADWVREPVLIDELKAFIGASKYKAAST